MRLSNHPHPLVTALSLLVMPLSGCETTDEFEGGNGACEIAIYMVAEWGTDSTVECEDDVPESTCDDWETTDGTYDTTTTFYEDLTCIEAGY